MSRYRVPSWFEISMWLRGALANGLRTFSWLFAGAQLLIPPAQAIVSGSISLSFNAPATVGDADDYFTDQGDPRDMNSNCDIGPDGWIHKPMSVAGGVWTGVKPQATGGKLDILPVAFPDTLVSHFENCTKLGNYYPVDASKYRTASWKIRVSQPSHFGFLWSRNNEVPGSGIYLWDGYFLPGAGVPTPANSWSIKHYYLPDNDSVNDWSGSISGLTIIPSQSQGPGTTMIDWIRLIDPSTSPVVRFNWNANGASGDPFANVAIYVDSDAANYDGQMLQRGIAVNGFYDLTTGILEPGLYYFYAQLESSNGLIPNVGARSNYLGPVRVNGSPSLKFISPSRTSGSEYSRDERLDPWDMNSASDLQNLTQADGTPTTPMFRGFHNHSFQNGYFFATSDGPQPGVEVDTQVHLTVPSNKPIDTSKYRYFCVNWQIDSTNLTRSGDPAQLYDAGWFTRLVWVKNGTGGNSLGSTRGHFPVESSNLYPDYQNGFVTYCYDMWIEPAEAGPTWLDISRVTTLRFDPLEATPATGFSINWAGLYAENKSNGSGLYDISLTVQDPENDNLDVALYYDSDRANFDGQLIATLTQRQPGTLSYSWNTTGIAAGSYYVYAVVSDGLNTTKTYADVILRLGIAENPDLFRRAPCDFDGDGKTDPTIVRSLRNGGAQWFSFLSSTNSAEIRTWGNTALDTFMDADFDGDRLSDEAAVRSKLQSIVGFYGVLSNTNSATVTNWGVLSDVPSLPDLDGDSKSDPTVWRPGDGSWWSIRSSLGALSTQWGLPGDIPAAADYDGDGWDDLAIWRPSLGFWAVLQSTRGAQRDLDNIIWKQWGLGVFGDHPLPGDYTGDGKADLMVWRPTDAAWYLCSSADGFSCSSPARLQFGLPGDYPIQADFDGDGIRDYAVWRPTDGTWYYKRSSTGTISAKQWGLPTDFPLCAGPRSIMNSIGVQPGS